MDSEAEKDLQLLVKDSSQVNQKLFLAYRFASILASICLSVSAPFITRPLCLYSFRGMGLNGSNQPDLSYIMYIVVFAHSVFSVPFYFMSICVPTCKEKGRAWKKKVYTVVYM